MTLYEIDEALLECVDPETGEIVDLDKLTELQMERDSKIESVGLWIKDLEANVTAYKAEIDSFKERMEKDKRKVEQLKNWLKFACDGSKFQTAKVVVSFRSSQAVEVDEEQLPKKWFRKKTVVEVDKAGIKEALKTVSKSRAQALLIN